MQDCLFTLRYRLSGGICTIKAWEGDFQAPNHTRIDVEMRWKPYSKHHRTASVVIFPRGATYCAVSLHTSLDGYAAKELVTSLIAMKPGDTDAEYFVGYTQEQLDWVECYGEELNCERQARYCDEDGNPKR